MVVVAAAEEVAEVVDLIRVQTRTKQARADTIIRRHRTSHYVLHDQSCSITVISFKGGRMYIRIYRLCNFLIYIKCENLIYDVLSFFPILIFELFTFLLTTLSSAPIHVKYNIYSTF